MPEASHATEATEATEPSNATDKVLAFLQEVVGLPDDQLEAAVPFAPPTAIRMTLGTVASQIPDDPAVLDELLLQLARFALSLRSDGVYPWQLVEGSGLEHDAGPDVDVAERDDFADELPAGPESSE